MAGEQSRKAFSKLNVNYIGIKENTMMTGKRIIGLLALLLLWTGGSQAALYTCKAYDNWEPKDEIFTLNGAISVGEDTPVGTVIYKASLWADQMGIVCSTPDESGLNQTIYFPARVDVINTPTSLVQGITLSPLGEKVYETNIPGVGVSVTAPQKMPYTWSEAYQTLHSLENSGSMRATFARLNLNLIKTGPISPGVINAINFPKLQITFLTPTVPAGSTFEGFPIPHSTVSYNGTIEIIKSTCRVEVADKVVDLGSYEVKDLINNTLNVTPWKDASLRLIGCQFSPGFYNRTNSSIDHLGGGKVGQGTRDNNTVRLSLSTTSAFFDSSLGIIALSSGANNATGIGIQIGVKTNSEIVPYNFNSNGVTFTPSSSDAQSLEIPIFARYAATTGEIRPGKANGAIIYTLDYL